MGENVRDLERLIEELLTIQYETYEEHSTEPLIKMVKLNIILFDATPLA